MDRMQATPRIRPTVGRIADTLEASYSPERSQQMQGLMRFLGVPEISQTLDRVSYGEPITQGAGMTTSLRPETQVSLAAALGLIPIGRASEPAAMAAGRAGERIAERSVPRVMERGGLPAEMLGAMAQGTQSPATVYHGTPHLFRRFDASKIGTGEGNQAYGYGLYLAESPDVANQYRQMLASKAYSKLEKVDRNNYRVTAPDGTVITEGVPLGTATRAKDAFDAKAGNLMQVDLPDEQIARMLDYDKPLNKQAPEVRKALENIGFKVDDRKLAEHDDALLNALMSDAATTPVPRRPMNWTGQEIMRELERNPSQYFPNAMQGRDLTRAMIDPRIGVSELLKRQGIPGIRFLDQGSRGAGQGTSNFVVFPGMEDMLRIEQINNQPIESLFQVLGR